MMFLVFIVWFHIQRIVPLPHRGCLRKGKPTEVRKIKEAWAEAVKQVPVLYPGVGGCTGCVQLTHCLQAVQVASSRPIVCKRLVCFNPCAYEVKAWFQSLQLQMQLVPLLRGAAHHGEPGGSEAAKNRAAT
jgi:hypothetical protein